jgi:TonB family protein
LPAAINAATTETASARAAATPAGQPDDQPSQTLAVGSASDAGSTDAGALGDAGASGSSVAASRAELVRQIDALVRERLVYPPLARRRNIEGVVKLTLLVDERGRLGGSFLAGGSGSSILDKAAKTLVEEIFPIYLAEGLEEPVYISIMISYSLTS